MSSGRKNAGERPDSLAYLLRLWPEDGGQGVWRASLESVDSHERRGFATLDELLDFLRRQTVAASAAASLSTADAWTERR